MKFNLQDKLRPQALKSGDTIGIVAPAGPFDRNQFDAGLEVIHRMGFGTLVDAGVYECRGFLAGDDAHRASQFNAMMADDAVQAVACARGGYGALRILSELDYDGFGRRPKPLIGFSDITAIHQAILLKCGLVTFHGPMVTSLSWADKASRRLWGDALRGQGDFAAPFEDLRVLKSGSAEGVFTGGNLATLCHMVGTPFGADYAGTILLIEDVGEVPYRIDRMLTHMKLAGVMDGIAGLVLGYFEDCGPADEIEALIMERFGDMDIPIVAGAHIGHGKNNMTVPLGVTAELDMDGPGLRFLESAFQAG